LSQGSLSKSVFNIPVILDLQESFMNTTIVFRLKATSSYFPETYQVKTKGAFDNNHYAESLKKRNESLIQRYQKGFIFPADTIVTTFSLTSDRVPTKQSVKCRLPNLPKKWTLRSPTFPF
jgi:hypothetical protein